MILAAEELAEAKEINNNLVFAFVVDEENLGLGTITLLLKGVEVDADVVCEPTDLRLCTVQYGYIEMRVRVLGRSIHGATPLMGENAIGRMIEVLKHLKDLPLLRLRGENKPAMNIGFIRGGKGDKASLFGVEGDRPRAGGLRGR